jgi:dephospho-CoA kinase
MYVICEAAILFESGNYKDFDLIVTVNGPSRIYRLRIKRENKCKDQVFEKKRQWTDVNSISKSDYVMREYGFLN